MARRQEAGGKSPDLIRGQVEGDVGGEGVVRTPLRLEFAGDDRADRRDLRGEGDVELAAGLDVATEAMRLAAQKLPILTKVVTREMQA